MAVEINDTDLEKLKEREIALKFTKKYDYEFCKENFIEAPCNIWGYINHLEERIMKLEELFKK